MLLLLRLLLVRLLVRLLLLLLLLLVGLVSAAAAVAAMAAVAAAVRPARASPPSFSSGAVRHPHPSSAVRLLLLVGPPAASHRHHAAPCAASARRGSRGARGHPSGRRAAAVGARHVGRPVHDSHGHDLVGELEVVVADARLWLFAGIREQRRRMSEGARRSGCAQRRRRAARTHALLPLTLCLYPVLCCRRTDADSCVRNASQ